MRASEVLMEYQAELRLIKMGFAIEECKMCHGMGFRFIGPKFFERFHACPKCDGSGTIFIRPEIKKWMEKEMGKEGEDEKNN